MKVLLISAISESKNGIVSFWEVILQLLSRIEKAWEKNNSMVCVGLDPSLEKLPEPIQKSEQPLFTFNKAIINATAPYACAYKPQFAYYAAAGAEEELKQTIEYIHKNYPDHLIILDSKRGDIGATAEMYAKESFERYGAHSVTVNPYMGEDTVAPFTQNETKGCFILCRTSNPAAQEIQDELCGEEKLYEKIARLASDQWNKNKNLGLVVGATAPEQMKKIQEIAPDLPFLVPGVGAQGGSVKDVVQSGLDKNRQGLLINSSRGIIYAGSGEDFAEKAGLAAKALHEEVQSFRI